MMATPGPGTNIFAAITGPCPDSLKPLQLALLGRVHQLQLDITEFQDAIRAEHLSRLQAEHTGLVARCREAMDEVIRLQSELAAAQSELVACANRSEKARNDATEFLSTRPHPSSYPSQQELRKWEGRRQAVEERRDSLLQEDRAAQYRYGYQNSLLVEARAKFSPLRQREEEIRAQLANEGIDVTAIAVEAEAVA